MNLDQLNLEIDKDLVSRKNDDGTTILMKMDDSETFYKIDGVAAEVWNELSAGKSVKSVIEEVANTYETDPSTVENDVKNLLTDLEKFNLIKLN